MSDRMDERLEAVAAEEAARVVEVAPRREPATPGEWVKENLFSSAFNSILTVAVAAAVGYLGWGLLHWIFVTADWTVVRSNLRSYMLGRFPAAETWRVWVCLYFVVALGGLTWGASGKRIEWTRRRRILAGVVVAVGLALFWYLVRGVTVWALSGAATALFFAAVQAGRRATFPGIHRALMTAWLLAFPVVVLVLQAFGGVAPLRWGGFMLNVMVAWVVILASFPIGMVLALGRRSSLRAISVASVGFIEFIRGVPLFTLLLFGQFVLPLLLPPGVGLPNIARALIMFTIFSAVYVAEIVRGGLQGVPEGQYEAARALGFPTRKLLRLVVLPQALRNTIPAMVGHFISVFKDTTLLALVAGFTEMLRSARRAAVALEFIGRQREALLAAAVLFWIVTYSMSKWSQRLERRVGLGER
jgi:general L-amino acid transport system permease protein